MQLTLSNLRKKRTLIVTETRLECGKIKKIKNLMQDGPATTYAVLR